MPIHCPVPTRLLSQEEFGALSYEVMADVFAIRNELGRFFDEAIYKQALAAHRPDVELEVPVDISFKDFSKRYFLDALVARGRLFEFKAVETLSPRHKAQLLHYQEALTHFMGGEARVLRRVPVQLDGLSLGEQLLRFAADGVVFKLTAFESEGDAPLFTAHARRLLQHTGLRAMLWVNIARHQITFTTLE